ncbi:MAG: hypothetical protein CM1200mP2_02350 [Planctomycetaceae bacterium]|nr:MAG: hypothetical protein CM1200mP2_02350 [Planctomycetaceae bacterium]
MVVISTRPDSVMLAESNRSRKDGGTGMTITSNNETTPAGTNRPRHRSAASRNPRVASGGIHASETGGMRSEKVRDECERTG